MNKREVKNRRGQTWVETVIYTLIALSLMGLVLSYVRPKIEEYRDKTIIEQSIQLMKDIDETVIGMGETGNQRLLELRINKGELKIDGQANLISFEIESAYAYSESGANEIYDGNIGITTIKEGKLNIVTLKRSYVGIYDIKYNEENKAKTFTQSSTPYKVLISNKKVGADSFIDFELT